MHYIETSAKCNINVSLVFHQLVRLIRFVPCTHSLKHN